MALPAPAPGSTVAVTGASSGIGEALARELARRGHHVTLLARRQERLEALAEALHDEHGTEAAVLRTDLADPDSRAAAAEELVHGDRVCAGLCNNAGVGAFGRVSEGDEHTLNLLVSLNVTAVLSLTAAVLPAMVERGEGAVLHMASINGHGPLPHNASYSASKAFVISHGEATHAELAGTGVSVTTVSPGPVRTEAYDAGAGADAIAELPLPWMPVAQVAKASIDGMERGARTVVPGLGPKAFAVGSRFAPRGVALPAMAAVGALGLPTRVRRLKRRGIV